MRLFLSSFLNKSSPPIRVAEVKHSIALSEKTLSFSTPPSDSKAFSLSKLDLEDEKAWGEQKKIEVFSSSWSYEKGLNFLDKGYGNLSLIIQIRRKYKSEGSIFDYIKLADCIINDYDTQHAEHNIREQKNVVTNTHILIEKLYGYPKDTDSFYRREINGLPWLTHNMVGMEAHEVFCLPISKDHYLWVDFEFKPLSFRGDWELQETAGAAADADEIASTLSMLFGSNDNIDFSNYEAISKSPFN